MNANSSAMEQGFFLAAHFVLFIALSGAAVAGTKPNSRRQIVVSLLAMIAFFFFIFLLARGIDDRFPPTCLTPGFLSTASANAALFGAGAIGVFYSLNFEFKEDSGVAGYVGLALAAVQFILTYTLPGGYTREFLNLICASMFTVSLAVLVHHSSLPRQKQARPAEATALQAAPRP